MRLIGTLAEKGEENPLAFSYYLTSQGIENECEESSEKQGESLYNIWIYDEDQVDYALQLLESYKSDPKDPRYHAQYASAIQAHQEKFAGVSSEKSEPEPEPRPRKRRILSPAPYGPISIFILLTVAFLFIWSQMGRENLVPPKIPGVIQAPLLSPVERVLLYDYPSYFETRDRLFKLYTPQEIENKEPPPPEAKKLIQKLKATPVWMGVYDRVILHFRQPDFPLEYKGALFEKIGEGQVWRLITPAFLHFDLLHIFFNVLWFILLGNQIEYRLGWFRYLIFLVTTAVLSNTAQYLMSGPFFMGLSGVVVGMAAFIWARQQKAPWEGYLLHRFTLIFLSIFVLGMFLLQTVFFVLQLLGKFELTIGIANTAHIVGGIVGYLLGRMRFFSLHTRHRN